MHTSKTLLAVLTTLAVSGVACVGSESASSIGRGWNWVERWCK